MISAIRYVAFGGGCMARIEQLVQAQQAFFYSGATKTIPYRLAQLKKLRQAVQAHEANLLTALRRDLNKAPFEGYETEVGLVLHELRQMERRLAKWTKPQKVRTPLMAMPAKSEIQEEPYGVVLIMAPWNYPFQLSIMPLAGAIAAGNCAVLKPSRDAPATAEAMAKLLEECFTPEYITVVQGGRQENSVLLEQKFDFIFFTGSVQVGKVVMEAAAKNLTPVCLELGGKSPCIVDETANLKMAAKRIAWGKLINAGQTCVAPDYLLVHEAVKPQLLALLEKEMAAAYGVQPQQNPDYPRMVNQKHYDRVMALLRSGGQVVFGGQGNPDTLQVAPAVVDGVTPEMPLMREEIFGPVLPVLSFKDLLEVVRLVRTMPKPLALYLFSRRRQTISYLLSALSFGGGCVNETVMHMATQHLPFGGVGDSGMGSYHGRYSFDLFSHKKGVLRKSNLFEPPVRYAPYTTMKERVLRWLLH